MERSAVILRPTFQKSKRDLLQSEQPDSDSAYIPTFFFLSSSFMEVAARLTCLSIHALPTPPINFHPTIEHSRLPQS